MRIAENAEKKTAEYWFKEGLSRECSHVILAYDYDMREICPVFIFPEDNVDLVAGSLSESSLRVMAVFCLYDEMETQLLEEFIPARRLISRVEN